MRHNHMDYYYSYYSVTILQVYYFMILFVYIVYRFHS